MRISPPHVPPTDRAECSSGKNIRRAIFVGSIVVLGACGDQATLPESAGFGPSPQLPPPHATLIPTVNIAPVKSWPEGATPVAAPGLRVAAFAESLDHPRWLYVLANGDVLVAETNAPAKPDDNKGIKGWITGLMMGRAGAGVPSANRITLLRPAADGTIQTRSVFLKGLNSPFGMALIGNDLYVANTDALVRYPYQAGQTRITDPGVKVVDLPGGPINHHWTKNVIASSDGQHLYVTVGSNSNVGDNGMEAEAGPRRHLGGRSAHRAASDFRLRAAQPCRSRLGTGDRGALDFGQRTRRNRQRPGAGLYDHGKGGCLLRLAL
jgi:glucose/arabinose dehydrogenase